MSQVAQPFAGYGQFGVITVEWMARAVAASRKALRVAWGLAALSRGPRTWVRVRQSRLAERLGYAQETVRRAIRELRAAGLVETRDRHHPDGGQAASEYRLTLRAVAALPEPDEPPPKAPILALRAAILEFVQAWGDATGGDGWDDVHSGRTRARVVSHPDGRTTYGEPLTLPAFCARHLRKRGWGDLRQRDIDAVLRDMEAEHRTQHVED